MGIPAQAGTGVRGARVPLARRLGALWLPCRARPGGYSPSRVSFARLLGALWPLVRPAAVVAAVAAAFGIGSPASALAQNTHLLLIAGLGGSPEYTDAFHGWMSRFADAATERHGVDPARIVYLGEKTELDPTRISARSTAENIRSAFAELGASMAEGDELLVLLAGHGTFRNGEARFNIPGPDLSADEFGFLLDGLGDRRVTFVNTTSASGPFVEALSRPDRTVIAATRTGRERNMTRFGLHFVEAFAGEDADVDKNSRVSMLEAFAYALREVEREYEGDNQLLTEHAVLDDNGDGEGSRQLDGQTGAEDGSDGALARRVFLSASAGLGVAMDEGVAASPALRALYEEKAEIESRIDSLRSVKDQMPLERYEDELEELLVELALKNRQIRTASGGSPPQPLAY